MNFFKRQWKSFSEYVSFNKKQIIVNVVIFIEVIFILLLIDLLTKHFLFQDPGPGLRGDVQHQNWLFGIRSIRNTSFTFIPALDIINIGEKVLISILNLVILIACCFAIIFVKLKTFVIFIGFIFAGSLGNTIDRFAFNYVRDIVFLPWFDRGTFNFADVDVILGCAGVSITMVLYYLFFKSKKER